MLEARLADVEREAAALRRLLCDGSRVQITEAILRPQAGRAALANFVAQDFAARSDRPAT